jgi:hypothetical protein
MKPTNVLCVSRRIRTGGDPEGPAQQQGQPARPSDAHLHPPGPSAQRFHRGGNTRMRSHNRRHNGEIRPPRLRNNAYLYNLQ